MNQVSYKPNGAIVFWSIPSEFELAKLKRNLQLVNMGHVTPKVKTDTHALQAALTELFKNDGLHKVISRAKSKVNGLEVQRIIQSDKNTYYVVAAGKVDEGKVEMEFGTYPDSVVQQEYERQKERVGGDSVGGALVKVVSELSGHSMKESGGVYWLPNNNLTKWRSVCDAIKDAAVDKGGCRIQMATTTFNDADAMIAVKEEFTREIMSEIAALQSQMSPEMGDKALANRMADAQKLQEKLEFYEQEVLGVTMTSVHEALISAISMRGLMAGLSLAVDMDDVAL